MSRTRRWSSLLSPLTWRYALAAVGPAGSSGAQFLLNLVLLSQVSATAFGRFTFLLILAQFAAAVWSALFCVVKWNDTSRGAVSSAINFLRTDGSRPVGIMLSMVDPASASAGALNYYSNKYSDYYQNYRS